MKNDSGKDVNISSIEGNKPGCWLSIFLFAVLFFLAVSCSGQTVNDLRPTVTMKEYVDMQAELNKEWMQRLVQIQFDNVNDNVAKANAAMEKRLDSINEFRGQLKDQAGTFITRDQLIGWIVGIIGMFFAFSRWQKDRKDSEDSKGKNIQSGDKVEVKK